MESRFLGIAEARAFHNNNVFLQDGEKQLPPPEDEYQIIWKKSAFLHNKNIFSIWMKKSFLFHKRHLCRWKKEVLFFFSQKETKEEYLICLEENILFYQKE